MHDYVTEPMAFGRLFLAGDAAHLVAPIAAKGMNLALHDAFLLGDALTAHLTSGDDSGLAGYSQACLRRVWDYQEFSQWLSSSTTALRRANRSARAPRSPGCGVCSRPAPRLPPSPSSIWARRPTTDRGSTEGPSGSPAYGAARPAPSVVRRPVAQPVVGDVERLVHQAPQMSVAQRIDHPAALLARGHQPREAQPRQMLADRGPRRPAHFRERADVSLAAGQRVQQGQPGAVAEEGQEFRSERELLVAGVRGCASCAGDRCMRALIRT